MTFFKKEKKVRDKHEFVTPTHSENNTSFSKEERFDTKIRFDFSLI